jgi:hypothetical protein
VTGLIAQLSDVYLDGIDGGSMQRVESVLCELGGETGNRSGHYSFYKSFF